MASPKATPGDRADSFASSATACLYFDPNKPLPEEEKNLKNFLRKLREKEAKLPKSEIKLTERNLTEFFNKDYNPEHDAFHEFRGPRKISVSEWLQLIP